MTTHGRTLIVAHSPTEERPHEWHALDEHLDSVGRIAAEFAQKFGAADIARLAGSLHDVGKASDAFQTYIRESWQARAGGRAGPRPGSVAIPRYSAGCSG